MVGIRKIGINTHIFGMGSADVTPPSILSDGNTVAWFDMALAYITKDGSDFVSQWDDRSGNTEHLLQATGTNQPLWQSTGVLFDGVDNFMKCAAFTFNQPEMIYVVFKHITWISLDYIWDGNVAGSSTFQQSGSSPNLVIYAGAASPGNGNLLLNTFGIVRVLYNGASSSLRVNETAATTGDFGASNMAGFTLGSRGDGGANYGHIEVKEIILRKIADTAPNEQIIYDYLENKYGL